VNRFVILDRLKTQRLAAHLHNDRQQHLARRARGEFLLVRQLDRELVAAIGEQKASVGERLDAEMLPRNGQVFHRRDDDAPHIAMAGVRRLRLSLGLLPPDLRGAGQLGDIGARSFVDAQLPAVSGHGVHCTESRKAIPCAIGNRVVSRAWTNV
jgi:hypothetical protein